jgi:hypothetical protein
MDQRAEIDPCLGKLETGLLLGVAPGLFRGEAGRQVPSRGIFAPLTRIGMTSTPRCKAASISRRTKSLGSSSRRLPSSSVIVTH